MSARCRKFCRVCGTSLFVMDLGWEVVPEDTEVQVDNMYNRMFQGKVGMTVDVSVGAMDIVRARNLVEVVEHTYLDDTIDGRHAFPESTLPKYPSPI